jgi:hypothetical protein
MSNPVPAKGDNNEGNTGSWYWTSKFQAKNITGDKGHWETLGYLSRRGHIAKMKCVQKTSKTELAT